MIAAKTNSVRRLEWHAGLVPVQLRILKQKTRHSWTLHDQFAIVIDAMAIVLSKNLSVFKWSESFNLPSSFPRALYDTHVDVPNRKISDHAIVFEKRRHLFGITKNRITVQARG